MHSGFGHLGEVRGQRVDAPPGGENGVGLRQTGRQRQVAQALHPIVPAQRAANVLAAVEIDRQRERGRAALTEREHAVFHRFVLGEVGEELRRRLAQADKLIKAMNASLRSIRTSHGIGVRLMWKLADETGADIARIKELVSTAALSAMPSKMTN